MESSRKGQQKLISIFADILDLPEGQVNLGLSPQTCEKWDSLNHIHLINAIEEEFDFSMGFEDQMGMVNFEAALEIVARNNL